MTLHASPRRPCSAALAAVLLVASGPAWAQATSPQRAAPAAQNADPRTQPRASSQEGARKEAKPEPTRTAAAGGPAGAQASLLATHGDWNAYATQSGRSKLCYVLSQPKDRLPATLNRDPGYVFVSFRPAENVRNEVAIMMGFPTKDGGAAEAAIGNTKYALITKDENAWVKNPTEEGQVIATMAKGQTLVIKAASRRGNETTDRYSLSGFGQALERARKEGS